MVVILVIPARVFRHVGSVGVNDRGPWPDRDPMDLLEVVDKTEDRLSHRVMACRRVGAHHQCAP